MLNYSTLPNQNMVGGMTRYFEQGIEPGSFLSSVLCNDLAGAVVNADDTNARLIREFVEWLYWEAPVGSWKSEKNFRAWCESGGQFGQNRAIIEAEEARS